MAMFSSIKHVILLSFGVILVLSTMASASLIDKGCKFTTLNVKIGGRAISCGDRLPLSDVGGNEGPMVEFSGAKEVGFVLYSLFIHFILLLKAITQKIVIFTFY